MKRFSFDVLTAKLALGSLWMVAIFLTTSGFTNLFPLVEQLTQTTTWQALIAIPIIVVSYTIGAVVLHASNWGAALIGKRSKVKENEISDFLLIARQDNELIASRYENTRHDLEFFRASMPTIVALAGSVFWSARLLPHNESLAARLLAFVTLLAVPLLYGMVARLRAEIRTLVDEIADNGQRP